MFAMEFCGQCDTCLFPEAQIEFSREKNVKFYNDLSQY